MSDVVPAETANTAPSSPRRLRNRHLRRARLFAALSIAAVGGAVTIWATTTSSRPNTATRVMATSTVTVPPATRTTIGPVGPGPSIPRELVVPALGINLAVGQLGLQANHEVQVPTSAQTVGWFRLGATPGQVGSAVILGHVDSYRGPGVFFNLKTLPVGASIEVRRADGNVMEFRVTRVVEFPKSAFPDALVYGATSGRYLNLVTCGGTFDHATGSYESNIVVFSRLVGVTKTITN